MAKAKQLAIKGKTLIDGNGGPVVKDPIIMLEGESHQIGWLQGQGHNSARRRSR